jgi:predicted metalloprotease with PDZ domain
LGYLAPGSPAEVAGLRLGDEVIAVNKNFSGILNEYKIELQKAGEKVRIIYRRDEKIGELEFRVLRIR